MKECMPDFLPIEGHPGSPCTIEVETLPQFLPQWTEICLTCGQTDREPPRMAGSWWEWWPWPWKETKAIEA